MFDCVALGIRLAAFRARIQAAFKFGNVMIYCSAQHTNQAHQSSRRFGHSRSGVRRRRLSTAGRRRLRRRSRSTAGRPLSLFLVVGTVRHGIALVEHTSALDWHNIADVGILRLVRLLHDFGSFGRWEAVALVERCHLPCDVLVEFLVREVLVAFKGPMVEVINPPLGAGVTSNVVSRKGDKTLHVGHHLL
jgi:hypothetical protein